MSTEENRAILHLFFEEVFNQKNPAALEKYFAPDMVENNLPPEGIEAHQQFLSMYFNAFPDLTVTVEDIVAEGDKVVARVSYRGTHLGEFMDILPTGKQIMITGIDIIRLTERKFVEHWQSADNLGLLQQLGVIPLMG
jgi:predicted ester cyclase